MGLDALGEVFRRVIGVFRSRDVFRGGVQEVFRVGAVQVLASGKVRKQQTCGRKVEAAPSDPAACG